MVFSSRNLAGMTTFTTFSIRLRLMSSRVISGTCCTDRTTVWTRRGSMAPSLSRYSTVTCRKTKSAPYFSFSATSKNEEGEYLKMFYPCVMNSSYLNGCHGDTVSSIGPSVRHHSLVIWSPVRSKDTLHCGTAPSSCS